MPEHFLDRFIKLVVVATLFTIVISFILAPFAPIPEATFVAIQNESLLNTIIQTISTAMFLGAIIPGSLLAHHYLHEKNSDYFFTVFALEVGMILGDSLYRLWIGFPFYYVLAIFITYQLVFVLFYRIANNMYRNYKK